MELKRLPKIIFQNKSLFQKHLKTYTKIKATRYNSFMTPQPKHIKKVINSLNTILSRMISSERLTVRVHLKDCL